MDNKKGEAMEELTAIKKKAAELRKEIIRIIYNAGTGHPGGSLSVTDILATLYYGFMNIDPKDPNKPDRDRCVLSKGHAAPALYCILADLGYFNKKELDTLRKPGSILQGHPDMKKTPGIDMSTGSLGQGLSAANGMAMSAKIDNLNHHVYAVLGDGELDEGQIWEAAMTAVHYKLDNLTAIVDYNKLQLDGKTEEIMNLGSLESKFKSFGWYTLVIDGHNYEDLYYAVKLAKNHKGSPTMIIANTVKGKGISFMENNVAWHGCAISDEQAAIAQQELME